MNPPFVPKRAVYRDQDDKRRLESRNIVIQTEFVLYQVSQWTGQSRLTPELFCKLQELAINQVYRCAGNLRDGPVTIHGVEHQPPPYQEVPGLVQEMCDYVHANWGRTPIHLASYLMWRINWIHPFYGGNGRTARAASYLVLCARLGFVLPGKKTIPESIVENREPYFDALQAADRAWCDGRLDLRPMEDLMSSLLARQLVAIHELATGKTGDDSF